MLWPALSHNPDGIECSSRIEAANDDGHGNHWPKERQRNTPEEPQGIRSVDLGSLIHLRRNALETRKKNQGNETGRQPDIWKCDRIEDEVRITQPGDVLRV